MPCPDAVRWTSGVGAALLTLVSAVALAEDDSVASPGTVDKVHGMIGAGVRGLADSLDRFFTDERSLAEEQQSRLRLIPQIEWVEADDPTASMPINARVVLPRLEDKLRLQLVTNEDEPDVAGSDEVPPEESDAASEDRSSFLGLVYTRIAEQARNVSVRGGLRAREGTLKLAMSLRGRYSDSIGEWTARLTQSFFYDGDEFGERTLVDFDRPIDRATLFRSTTGVTVTESSAGAELLQRFQLRRRLSERSAVELFVSTEGHTDPAVVADEHKIGITYRQRIWKEWLTVSLRPELRYPRELEFDREAALIIALEAVF